MNDSKAMTIDTEGVSDAAPISGFAILAVIFAIPGLLAVIASSFFWFCLVSMLLGMLALVLNRGREMSATSYRLATWSILVSLGCFVSALGFIWYHDQLLNRQATQVAKVYVDALAAGDREKAINMVGLPLLVEEPGADEQSLSREQKAVRNFLADENVREVMARGKNAEWVANRIGTKYRRGNGIDMDVQFIDAKETNARPLIVVLRLELPERDKVQQRHWYIERVVFAKK